jgi:hypothetical protein
LIIWWYAQESKFEQHLLPDFTFSFRYKIVVSCDFVIKHELLLGVRTKPLGIKAFRTSAFYCIMLEQINGEPAKPINGTASFNISFG